MASTHALANARSLRPIELILGLVIVMGSLALLATPYYEAAIFVPLAVLAGALITRWPVLGYLVIVALIPFDPWRQLGFGPRQLTVSKLVGVWLVGLVALSFVMSIGIRPRVRTNLWPALLVMFVIWVISGLMSEFQATAWNNVRKLVAAFAFMVLSLTFINNSKRYEKTVPGLVVATAAFSGLLAIAGYLFDIPALAVTYGDLTRSVGGGQNANGLALLMVYHLPLVAHFFFTRRRLASRFFYMMLAVIYLVAIVLTYSRSGALALAIVLFFLFFEHLRRFRARYLGFIGFFVVVAIVLLVSFLPSSYWERQRSMVGPPDEAIARRLSYIHLGMDVFPERPVLGYGPGTFRDLYGGSYYAFAFVEPDRDPRRFAHNAYLELLVGTGVIGLLAFLFVLGVAWRNFSLANRLLQKSGRDTLASITRAWRLGFLMLVISRLVGSELYLKYFWLYLALSQVALWLAQEPVEERTDERDLAPAHQ